MKKWLYILSLFFLPVGVYSQIPNPDFEQWQSISSDVPRGWTTFGTIQKVQGYKSNFAVRISRDPSQGDAPGAVVYGFPDQGFSGGVPFTGRPDSVVAFMKYYLEPGDSALIVAFMKRNGNTIGANNILFTGGDSNVFLRMAFPLYYSDTGLTDTVVVGIACTNPEDTFSKSFAVIDSIHFTGSKVYPALPNSNFELWDHLVRDEPMGWVTMNNRVPPGLPFTVTKTTDRKYSSYAARIQNIAIPGGQFVPGFVLAGRQGNMGPEPGFPITFRDSVLYMNYKFFPVNRDTLNIGILMFEKGKMVGGGFLNGGDTVSTWTEVGINIGYFPLYAGTPDSAAIFAAPFQGGTDPTGESVLYVDGFKLNTPMTHVFRPATVSNPLQVFPNPASQEIVVLYNVDVAGDVSVSLFDSRGAEVAVLHNGYLPKGRFAGQFNLQRIPQGIYQCVFRTADSLITSRVVVQK